MKKVLFILVCLFVGISVSKAQISLSFSPEKGAKYNYNYNMEVDTKQSVMGQDMSMKQKMVMMYDMDILDNTKDDVKIGFTYKDIYYELASAMMNMKYDSKNPSAGSSEMDTMIAKIFGALLGKPFEVVIAPDGSVKSVVGMEAVVQDMMKAAEGFGMTGQQISASFSQQFSDNVIKKSFEQSLKIYPTQKVKVGDTWDIEQKGDVSGMPFVTESTYQLMSTDKKIAFVNVKSDIDGMNGQLKGEQTGSFELELKSGMSMNSQITNHIKGTVSANGMEIPVEATTEIGIVTNRVK